MNLLNLPMMDSAVFKKMNAGKQAKTPDAATQAHDSKKRPLVPVAVRDELLTMGISAKKMRSTVAGASGCEMFRRWWQQEWQRRCRNE